MTNFSNITVSVVDPTFTNGAVSTINQRYGQAISEGYVANHEVFSKRGFHPATTAAETTLWYPGTAYVFPTVGMQMEVVSTSAEDSSAGTGIRSMRIKYLDSTYAEQTEDIVLNGLTPVATTAIDIFRVNSFFGYTFGSTGKAVGAISIRHLSDTPLYSQLGAGETSCFCSVYTVPLGKRVHIDDVLFTAGYSTAGKFVRMKLHASLAPDETTVLTTGTVFYSKLHVGLVDGAFQSRTDFSRIFPEKTDIKITVIGETNAICTSEIRGWIEAA